MNFVSFVSNLRGTQTILAVAAMAASVVLGLAALQPSLAASQPIDVNTASAAELAMLPGIGEAKAKAIVEERERSPFASVDELERVSGIGPKTVADLREHVTAGTKPGD